MTMSDVHSLPSDPLPAEEAGFGARSLLLRSFVPTTAAAILLGSLLHGQFFSRLDLNPVLLSAGWALLFTGAGTFLVAGTARRVGACLEAAERRIETLNEALRQRVEELAQTNERLAQKNEENELFVYSVSHDLRSPLVNLQGFSKELEFAGNDLRTILAESNLPPAVRDQGLRLIDDEMAQSIQFIRTAVSRLANIIEALLRLSRAGRLEIRWQPVDLQTLVARIVDTLQATIEQRGARLTVHDLPPAYGDPTVLDQIFANLLGNALNYLDPGRPGVLEVGVESPEADSAQRVYYVRDNGLGIPEAAQAKVFQAFQRLHPEAAKGEGMGLTIVRRFVERHGGRIWFRSRAGQGTTFFVSLPPPPESGDEADDTTATGRSATHAQG